MLSPESVGMYGEQLKLLLVRTVAKLASLAFQQTHLRRFPYQWTPGIAVDVAAEIGTLTMEVIGRVLFGTGPSRQRRAGRPGRDAAAEPDTGRGDAAGVFAV